MSSVKPNSDTAQAAIVELNGLADMFKRIQETCWKKCISDISDSLLSPGEISCTDRCIAKYMETHTLIGNYLQGTSENKSPK
ncbi:TIM10 DDP zinc finger domain-containing protein [Cryptosporidium andersoni]|uniref:Mitochondrial import inner membrane translocase subunit n=1 Tax=Cryptosporidium andersoni TaxID=117008 RepID=A0A1J4MUZ6_9CRYT|nr:TIM10 DDP zinc finger domain-containing protein [Cryptosporidium andersoni]